MDTVNLGGDKMKCFFCKSKIKNGGTKLISGDTICKDCVECSVLIANCILCDNCAVSCGFLNRILDKDTTYEDECCVECIESCSE